MSDPKRGVPVGDKETWERVQRLSAWFDGLRPEERANYTAVASYWEKIEADAEACQTADDVAAEVRAMVLEWVATGQVERIRDMAAHVASPSLADAADVAEQRRSSGTAIKR